ncbi:MAG: hypothetical protein ACE5I3_15205, partial [Phycisphaerae bacterium]
ALQRISLVLKGDPLDESVLRLADYMKTRFEAEVRLHWPSSVDGAQASAVARQHGLARASGPFDSTAELVGQIALTHGQLVLIPEPQDEQARVVDKDALVKGTAPPILLVRRPLEQPTTVFRSILHSLSGNFQQTENFSYSFALVEEHGALRLLHAIDQDDLETVREAMQVSPDVSDQDEKEILQHLTHHGERYLKAVVIASRKFPYEVTYRLRLGNVVSVVQQELAGGSYGLLVVGHHEEGHSRITAADYQLIHLVRDVPVLAL